jgi:L-methionine (R)-S-oxide reductase
MVSSAPADLQPVFPYSTPWTGVHQSYHGPKAATWEGKSVNDVAFLPAFSPDVSAVRRREWKYAFQEKNMTALTSTLPQGASKSETYQGVMRDLIAVLEGEGNRVARMATTVCLLSQAFPAWFWTGFYVVDTVKKLQGQDELIVGPYNGTLGCLRIAFSRGVCGAAARERATQIVQDVHAFPGHIACDSRSNSEIVVPVFDGAGDLIAVFDVDSEAYGAFDEEDRDGLEAIMKSVFATD